MAQVLRKSDGSRWLLIDRGQSRIGFEFKAGGAIDPGDWTYLQSGLDDGVIHRGIVVYNGTRRFSVNDRISVVPAEEILSSAVEW